MSTEHCTRAHTLNDTIKTISLFSIFLHIYQKPMRNVTSAWWCFCSSFVLSTRFIFFVRFLPSYLIIYVISISFTLWTMLLYIYFASISNTYTNQFPNECVGCFNFKFFRRLVCMLEVIRLTSFLIKIRILKYLVSLWWHRRKEETKQILWFGCFILIAFIFS